VRGFYNGIAEKTYIRALLKKIYIRVLLKKIYSYLYKKIIHVIYKFRNRMNIHVIMICRREDMEIIADPDVDATLYYFSVKN
jgi:hypothetical protein